MEKIVPQDLFHYRYLSGLHFAPDGEKAAFVVKTADETQNGYRSHLWLLGRGQNPFQLTAAGNEAVYCWADAETILFTDTRTEDEKKRRAAGIDFSSCYGISVHGGEARKLFEIPFAVSQLNVLDENRLVAVGTIDAANPDLYTKTPAEKQAYAAQIKAEADFQVLDELPFRFNGMGYTNKKRTAVFLVNRRDGTAQRISDPLDEVAAYTVADGKLYYAAENFSGKRLYRQAIYCYDPAAGKRTCLYNGGGYEISYMTVLDDGLVFAGCTQERYGYNENPMFYRLPLSGGTVTLFSDNPDSLHPAIGSDMRLGATRLVQTHGQEIYYLATRRDSVCLMKMDAAGNRSVVIGDTGTVDDFAVNPADGSLLAVGLYDGLPQELYTFAADGTERRCVSAFNKAAVAGKYIAKPESIRFTCHGQELDGWILRPMDYDPEKTYPGVLDIHGGPKMAYGPVFYHEMQVWAGMGYFVFFCNPIGSDGRGNDFVDMRGKYGTVDYDSIMAFVDAVQAQYPQIDSKRIAVTGGSYGGYMTNWIITHTDRFVCAASQRSISNWLSFYGYSDLGYNFNVDQLAVNPFTDHAVMWDRSPMKYAGNVHTPTLFLHSDEDYRCPLGEGLQMYTALLDAGVPTRLCLFHGENHELSRSGRPRSRLRRLTEICNWFEKYCRL